jgi:6-phosphogluconate dehydrogenase (decarboxylating)
MQIAMVGLGRMGANMVRRLMRAGHECVVYDHASEPITALQNEGAIPSHSNLSTWGKAGSSTRGQARSMASPCSWSMMPPCKPWEAIVEDGCCS